MLLRDVERFAVLGELKWITINLIDCELFNSELKEEFNNTRQNGFFEDGRIYISYSVDWVNKLYNILYIILDLIEDPSLIESITGLIELEIGGKIVDVVIEVDGKTAFPKVIEISDEKRHFDIINYIQLKWNKALLYI